MAELKIEKDLIDLKDNPIKDYNYSYIKDSFKALRDNRIVDPYRKISFNKLKLPISGAPVKETVNLRIIPYMESGIA